MLDTAIVGSGLCGLSLAAGLKGRGRTFALFDARERLGGRAYSVDGFDLGPTWFWPDIHPRMKRLVEDHDLAHFPQHDTGAVQQLFDPDKKPEKVHAPEVHGGARRIPGGVASLVDALAKDIPEEAVFLGRELLAVKNAGDHVELVFDFNGAQEIVRAKRAVLAIPPRILEERVQFEPDLSDGTKEAMRKTPTWMANQAKAAIRFASPFWRLAGESGNAFVRHEQAVLGEIYDACDGNRAALAGFFALPVDFRAAIGEESIKMLVSSQLVQIFGIEAAAGEQHIKDWANDVHTCSTLDLEPETGHPAYGNRTLAAPMWENRLFLGSSESAEYGGGYMEGALDAAARILRDIAETDSEPGTNDACIVRFGKSVRALRDGALSRYRQNLQRRLAAQAREHLTRNALIETVEAVYSEALARIDDLPFDASRAGVHRGRSDLTPSVLEPFDGFIGSLLEEVRTFNMGSCAISNFPEEHELAEDYLKTITGDLASAWRRFAIGVNDSLLKRTHGA